MKMPLSMTMSGLSLTLCCWMVQPVLSNCPKGGLCNGRGFMGPEPCKYCNRKAHEEYWEKYYKNLRDQPTPAATAYADPYKCKLCNGTGSSGGFKCRCAYGSVPDRST